MTLGGAAQVAAAHCPNERTLDPTVCNYNRPTYAPASHTMAFTPQCSLSTTHLLFFLGCRHKISQLTHAQDTCTKYNAGLLGASSKHPGCIITMFLIRFSDFMC